MQSGQSVTRIYRKCNNNYQSIRENFKTHIINIYPDLNKFSNRQWLMSILSVKIPEEIYLDTDVFKNKCTKINIKVYIINFIVIVLKMIKIIVIVLLVNCLKILFTSVTNMYNILIIYFLNILLIYLRIFLLIG